MHTLHHLAHDVFATCSYLEQEQHMLLTAHCLDVEFAGTQHHMQIDLATVEALELIKPLAAGGATKKGNSLYRYPHTLPHSSITIRPQRNVHLLGIGHF